MHREVGARTSSPQEPFGDLPNESESTSPEFQQPVTCWVIDHPSFEMEIRQTFSFVAIAPMFVICWSREKGFFRADKYCGFHALQALGWEN
ncbi:MAG: hypothetical protein CXT69_05760 [Methanobacteriota archaeon]|nr:MAG: hypothetical protein CXT69_05760 [Euryarchaeota archaeon]